MKITVLLLGLILIGCAKPESSSCPEKNTAYEMAIEANQLTQSHLDSMHWINKSFVLLGYDQGLKDTLSAIYSLQGQVYSTLKEIQRQGDKNENLPYALDTLTRLIERNEMVRKYKLKFPAINNELDLSKKELYAQYLLNCDLFFEYLNFKFTVSILDMMVRKFPPPPLE